MYNASFLLTKTPFLESVAAGTARPHVVLSVCAWGANFYRDTDGEASLKNNGSMIEWAKRAGKLVFEEAEELFEENVVTFCNLALFWHSQGSWRISDLHKGNAYQLLHINGLGPTAPGDQKSLECEIRRRRFWTCYLMHCYSSEKLPLFEPVADMQDLPLPWPEDDFESGVSRHATVSLDSNRSNGGMFSELVRGLTLWSQVVSSVKSREPGFNTKLTSIYALDENVSDWWETVPPDFKLTPSSIAAVPHDALPKVFLFNLVYHQSLCVLHASIVPLFSWGPGGHSSTARQLSAQVAFEHACTVSALISTVLSTYPQLSAMPSFVAYVAYSGCAIQMPFMWCLNSAVKERAHANVRANVKMIHAMASYWKFAELLMIHVRCLFSAYQNNPTILDDEPKFIDSTELTSFKINATLARASILEFTGVLRPEGDGYVKPGEETRDLGIQNDGTGAGPESVMSDLDASQSSAITPSHTQTQEALVSSQNLQETWPQQPLLPDPLASLSLSQSNIPAAGIPTLEVFNSFIDPDMLNLFSHSEIPNFSQFGIDLFSLDYLE